MHNVFSCQGKTAKKSLHRNNSLSLKTSLKEEKWMKWNYIQQKVERNNENEREAECTEWDLLLVFRMPLAGN